MFAAVQIPLADLRHFVAEPTGRLPVPPWPLADPSKHFVRAVGPVRERRRGGVPEWIGESLYCDARRAVVFPAERGVLEHAGNTYVHLTPLYRRFLATGRAQWSSTVARVDIGFKVRSLDDNGRATGRMLPTPDEAALAAATVILRVPPDDRSRALLEVTGAIAERIRNATTSLIEPPASPSRWWVQAGRPLVMIEAPSTPEFIATLNPPMDIGTAAPEGHDILALQHFSRLEYHGQRVPVWTLFYNDSIHPGQLRLLRIHLWRLHNEHEVLRIVLAACIQRQLDPSYPALRDYLARQSSSLRQVKREGLSQADLLFHAYALDTLVNASNIETLAEILRDVSPGLAASVLPLVHTAPATARAVYITINGGIQMADKIDNNDSSQKSETHGPVGAIIGGQAKVKGGSYQGSGTQNIQILDSVDMPQLAIELQRLVTALEEQASSPEQKAEVEQVKAAGAAAQQSDKASVWEHLTKVGKWVLNVATQVGVGIAAAVIAAAIVI
jgi:hypothetical protein